MNKAPKINPKTGQPYPQDLAIGYYGEEGKAVKVSVTINIDELIAQCGDTGTVKLVGFDATVDKDGNPRKNLSDKSPHLRFIKSQPKAAAPARGRSAAPAGRKAGGYPF
jgi:hypothetical protein